MDSSCLVKFNMSESDVQDIKEIKARAKEYLGNGEGSEMVRDYLSKCMDNEALLMCFLVGRKHRPKHAWETLKRYAEVRFQTYPEVFPPEFPREIVRLQENALIGVLKHRDSKGRRIGYFIGSAWDTDKINVEMLTITAVHFAERMIRDEDCMNNGLVFIQECTGMGLRHTKEYTLKGMLRFMNVFWYAFPMKVKGVYYVNVPYILTMMYGLIKPFFPKKLKERFVITSTGKNFEALHADISPDILPKVLGGKLDNHEAFDYEALRFY